MFFYAGLPGWILPSVVMILCLNKDEIMFYFNSVRIFWLFYRYIDWFILEGTNKDHLVQVPCCGQGHLHLTRLLS